MEHKTITKRCKCCQAPIVVRLADHKRGWGNYCDKSCKAKHQSRKTGISGPDYRASGMSVNQMNRGHYAETKFEDDEYDEHPFSCDGLGQW